MSFTTAYARLRTELETLFPTYNEIDNPYVLESNELVNLKLSYGITVGPAINTTRTTNNRADIERRFGIVLSREVFILKNDTTRRIVAEKALFEDLTSIIKVFEGRLAGVTRARYEDDAGLEFLGGDKYNNFVLKASFLVEYSETL